MIVDPLDNLFKKMGNNFDEVRGRSLALSVYCPRTPSLFSSDCDEDYVTRMQKESDRMDEDNPVTTSNSIQLKYMTPKSQNGQFSKTANSSKVAGQQRVANKKPVLNINSPSENNVVNVQLNYDINQALNPKSWDGNF